VYKVLSPMHRLQYSEKELDILKGYLNPTLDPNGYIGNWAPIATIAIDLYNILNLRGEDLDTLYGHKYLYDAVKENIPQRHWQTMYHIPLKEMPLLINHKDPLIVAIAKWRLSIAR